MYSIHIHISYPYCDFQKIRSKPTALRFNSTGNYIHAESLFFWFTHSRHLSLSSNQWKIHQATNNPQQCPFHSICLTSSPSRKSVWINEPIVPRKGLNDVSKIERFLRTCADWFVYFSRKYRYWWSGPLRHIARQLVFFSTRTLATPLAVRAGLTFEPTENESSLEWEALTVCVDKIDFFYAEKT